MSKASFPHLGFISWLLAAAALALAAPVAAAQDGGGAADVVEFQRLMEQYVTLRPAPDEGRLIPAWRDETLEQVGQLITGLETLAGRTGKPADVMLVLALCHAKRASVLLDQRRDLDAEYSGEIAAGKTRESLAKDRADLVARRADLAERVAAEYRKVDEVLSEALASAEALKGDREAAQLNLITGVVLAQSAIVQDAAIDAMQDAGRRPTIAPALFRELLDRSATLLAEYLSKTPRESGLEWVRGQYYLGVVSYRRSLAMRVQGEEYFTRVDTADARAAESYAAARQIFNSLADSEELARVLKSEGPMSERAARAFQNSSFVLRNRYDENAVARYYAASANLYLGLMTAIDPDLADKPIERLNMASEFLRRAAALDRSAPNPREPEISLTKETIPTSTEKVIRELTEATKTAEAKPINDFSISWGIGYVYDSNVILLGRDTATPIGKDRKRDSRVPGLIHIGYTADLDAIAPNDPLLRRFQIFVEGRTSATWNARIHDFNEQMYGATVNVRYELLGPGAVENLDGAYLNWRYDYDYVLLGNDGFLRLNRLRPSLDMVAFDGLFQPSLHFTFEDRNYLEELTDERFDRDGNYISSGFDLRFDLGRWVDADRLWGRDAWGVAAPHKDDAGAWRRPMEVNAGLDFTSNSTQGDEFDYSSAILTAGVRFPLPFGMDFFYTALFEWQDYWQNSRIDRNRNVREDFIQEHGFRLERRFFLTNYPKDYENARPLQLERLVMTVFGDIRFTIDDSNVRDRLGQSVFEYNRVWYGAGMRFDLN
ncbi:MAG: hypothetical protein AMXMBFR47_25660 [Planctomycetota bacterium]